MEAEVIGGCFLHPSTEVEVRGCIRDALGRTSVQALASQLCSTTSVAGRGAEDHPTRLLWATSELLLATPPVRGINVLAILLEGCRSSESFQPLLQALFDVRAKDPHWFAAFRGLLSSSQLFDPALGELGIWLLLQLAREGDREAAEILRHGALGEAGGTPEQAALALHAVLSTAGGPGDRLLEIQGALASPTLAGEARERVASVAALALLAPASWRDGSPDDALTLLFHLLHDVSLELVAATQVVDVFSAEHPPEGADPDLWAAVWDRALQVARSHGLVLGSKSF